ncbi:hypothetical protein HKBW3S06_01603, partial [Candidatus Hakubella thermalkaliphila]
AFGRVTVEGMLLKKPVIGARGGATPELIQEDFTGLLYTPGDHKELDKKIRYLIDNPEIARRISENAYRWAKERSTIARYTEQVLDVLREALHRKSVNSRAAKF